MKYCAIYVSSISVLLNGATGCTIIGVGKVAGGGSTFLAHTDDAGGGTQDVRLIRVPATNWPKDSKRNIYKTEDPYPRLVVNERGPHYTPYEELNGDGLPNMGNENYSIPLGSIPQINHTYGYWDTDYGIMNDQSLSIAESTCGARTAGWALNQHQSHHGNSGNDGGSSDGETNNEYNNEDARGDSEGGNCLFGIDELTRIALERCDSARCAIETMGKLGEEYGFYSNAVGSKEAPLYDDSAECLGISDRYGEVWMFHIMTGLNHKSAIWVGKRLKDTDVTVIANGMVIRDVYLQDTENYLASSNIIKHAKEMNWYVPGSKNSDSGVRADIDFTATFGPILDYSNGLPISILYIGRRVWRVLSLFAPSLNLDPRLGHIPQVDQKNNT